PSAVSGNWEPVFPSRSPEEQMVRAGQSLCGSPNDSKPLPESKRPGPQQCFCETRDDPGLGLPKLLPARGNLLDPLSNPCCYQLYRRPALTLPVCASPLNLYAPL